MYYFHNYKGECWHNALTSILCFCDELKENIFNQFTTSSTKNIISNARKKFITLPLNIEKENIDEFYAHMKHYIGSIKTRVLQLGTPNFTIVNKKLSCEQKTSIRCIKYIYNITNINIINNMKRHFNINSHSGSLDTYMTIISIFNHFLLNNKCIVIKDDIFNNIKYSLSNLNKCIGMIIRLTKKDTKINHLVALYKNNNKYIFYNDNNGIKIYNWKKYLNLSINEDYKYYKNYIHNMINKLNNNTMYEILSVSYVVVKKYNMNNFMKIQKEHICNYLYYYNNNRVIDNIKFLNYNIINKRNIYFDIQLILSASMDGNVNVVKQLLEKKSRINVIDDDGDTPLNCATKNGHYDIVKILVCYKALIFIKDKYGNTPLKNAIKNKQNDIVDFLLSI